MPRQVLAAYAVVALVAVVAMAWLGVVPGDDGAQRTHDSSATPTSSPSAPDSAPSSTSAPPSDDSAGTTPDAREHDSDAPTDPSASDTQPSVDTSDTSGNGDSGVEVLPTDPETTEGLPGLDTKPPDTKQPLIDLPLPDSAVAKDSLAKGFPRKVLGPRKKSAIVTSSVSPAADVNSLQVALVATTRAGADAVLRDYRIRLAKLGFTETDAALPVIGGSSAASFIRGDDTVVVTATPGADETTYTAYGTLHASGS
ncbi:hypothetical protein ncot_15545 [Nocardioides sp. JQ2195]|uniref:hypothetical protein n=1 Tax=Nocardioides sp. JQ2195 TaxID=2592334 RepID=UPI00143E49D6|nr:hypothetical protein [Nocardioides sp. JQ2195]QIX27845.1 hypothetical protein ncot_15545 [Nocardioides sp. JQ2195]